MRHADEEPASVADGPSTAAVDAAPGLSAPLGEAGGRGAGASLLLPSILALTLIRTNRWLAWVERPPAARAVRPPTPPPRLVRAAR